MISGRVFALGTDIASLGIDVVLCSVRGNFGTARAHARMGDHVAGLPAHMRG